MICVGMHGIGNLKIKNKFVQNYIDMKIFLIIYNLESNLKDCFYKN